MRLDPPALGHLTYCTNVHPGETWDAVRRVLSDEVPAVKARVAPDHAFGVGLRLSAAAAEALSAPTAVAELRALLAERGLYVFTLNGFPYGRFHGGPVKNRVYQPDWCRPERGVYTDRLAGILAAVLPVGMTGSISTVPGTTRARAAEPGAVAGMTEALIRHAAHLVGLERATGRTLVLALEPEAGCFLETTGEAIGFFRDHLHAPTATARLAALTGLAPPQAEAALHRHLGVCLDVCHAAVQFEDPLAAVDDLEAAGIVLAKVQLSVAVEAGPPVDDAAVAALAAFDDGVYLHQVVARGPDGGVRRFPDLAEALAAPGDARQRTWRVHVHVPVDRDAAGAVRTTRPALEAVLDRHRRRPVTAHLEVETYTWPLLPGPLLPGPLLPGPLLPGPLLPGSLLPGPLLPGAPAAEALPEAVAREIDWVRGRLRP